MMTIDEQISAIELEVALLKDERRILNKKIIKNKQNIASMLNTLKKLKEAKRRENREPVYPGRHDGHAGPDDR